ncbi:MAG: molybdopterin-binding protein [Thermomicrobiales bacterium]|nr:molybdopterin-binding protein [Thermomicrobiales bacterium]
MKPLIIDPAALPDRDLLVGAVLAEDARAGGKKRFAKGHRLTAEDAATLAELDEPIHAVQLEPGEIHEDQAALRLAAAVAGPGLERRGPSQSRYNLVAAHKGQVRVDVDRLRAINRVPGMAVFTLHNRVATVPGKVVTGVKITPVATPESALVAAERIAAGEPIVQVAPFQPLVVGVISSEGMSDRVRQRFRDIVTRKMGWYGARVLRFVEVPPEADAVGEAVAALRADGADVILSAGGNTIDPLDPALAALQRMGAEMVRFGAPVHPGSMFWMAYLDETPVVNLASCGMYAKASVADLVLPTVMSGARVDIDELADLGYGGLLDRGMAFKFPPYDEDAASEEE